MSVNLTFDCSYFIELNYLQLLYQITLNCSSSFFSGRKVKIGKDFERTKKVPKKSHGCGRWSEQLYSLRGDLLRGYNHWWSWLLPRFGSCLVDKSKSEFDWSEISSKTAFLIKLKLLESADLKKTAVLEICSIKIYSFRSLKFLKSTVLKLAILEVCN